MVGHRSLVYGKRSFGRVHCDGNLRALGHGVFYLGLKLDMKVARSLCLTDEAAHDL